MVKSYIAASSWDFGPVRSHMFSPVRDTESAHPLGQKKTPGRTGPNRVERTPLLREKKTAAQKNNQSPGLLAGGRPFRDCPFCLFALYGLEDGIIVDKGSRRAEGRVSTLQTAVFSFIYRPIFQWSPVQFQAGFFFFFSQGAADCKVTLPSSGLLAPVSLLSVPSGWLCNSLLSLSLLLSFSLSLFLKKVFIPSRKKKKLTLGKQPTLLELRDNNQFLWACEIGSLSVLFNRKYWKRLSLLS